MKSKWKQNLAAGMCGTCGKRKPLKGITRCKVCKLKLAADFVRWGKLNPKKLAKHRAANKTAAGRAYQARYHKKHRFKRNLRVKVWKALTDYRAHAKVISG